MIRFERDKRQHLLVALSATFASFVAAGSIAWLGVWLPHTVSSNLIISIVLGTLICGIGFLFVFPFMSMILSGIAGAIAGLANVVIPGGRRS